LRDGEAGQKNIPATGYCRPCGNLCGRSRLHPWAKGGALVDVYWRKSDGFMMARYLDYAEFMNGINYPLREVSGRQVARLESFASDKQ